jgi:hypothetical protein
MEGKRFSLLQNWQQTGQPLSTLSSKCHRAPKSCPGNSINGANVYIGRMGCGLLSADDKLKTPPALTDAEQIKPILTLYEEYTGVRGLNISIAKHSAVYQDPCPII